MQYIHLFFAVIFSSWCEAAQYAPPPLALAAPMLPLEQHEQAQPPHVQAIEHPLTLKTTRFVAYTCGIISGMNGIMQLLNTLNEPTPKTQTDITIAVSCASFAMPIFLGGLGCWIIKQAREREHTTRALPHLSRPDLMYTRHISHATQDLGKVLLTTCCSGTTRLLSFLMPQSSVVFDLVGGCIATSMPAYMLIKNFENYVAKDCGSLPEHNESV